MHKKTEKLIDLARDIVDTAVDRKADLEKSKLLFSIILNDFPIPSLEATRKVLHLGCNDATVMDVLDDENAPIVAVRYILALHKVSIDRNALGQLFERFADTYQFVVLDA